MVRQRFSLPHALFRRFLSDTSGATAVEYGLIATAIAVVIVGAIVLVGDNLLPIYESFEDPLSDY